MGNQNKEVEAANKIKRALRQYIARIKSQAPDQPAPEPYQVMVLGNEPDPGYPMQKLNNQRFVYIGTGALQNFRWIKELQGEVPVVPTMFIVDSSKEVCEFWMHLKKAFAATDTFHDFFIKLYESKAVFRSLANTHYKDNAERKIVMMIHGLSLDNQKFGFDFFKQLASEMTVIRADWENPRVRAYINANTDPALPKYVYLSNIIEYTAFDLDFEPAADMKIQTILNQVDLLENTQCVIHARTSLKKSYEHYLDGELHYNYLPIQPDVFYFAQGGKKKDEYFSDLKDQTLFPLDRKDQMEAIAGTPFPSQMPSTATAAPVIHAADILSSRPVPNGNLGSNRKIDFF